MTKSHDSEVARLTRGEAIARVELAGFVLLLALAGERGRARLWRRRQQPRRR